jgi:hypothetical protein
MVYLSSVQLTERMHQAATRWRKAVKLADAQREDLALAETVIEKIEELSLEAGVNENFVAIEIGMMQRCRRELREALDEAATLASRVAGLSDTIATCNEELARRRRTALRSR